MGATLYEPINVYKPLAPNIGVVDGPFEYFTVAGIRMPMPFTTRMTVVHLGNGDLFLHSPIRVRREFGGRTSTTGDRSTSDLAQPVALRTYRRVAEGVSEGGPARASSGVRRRATARHIEAHFTRDLEEHPPLEWRDEIDQTLIPGGIFQRVRVLPRSIGNAHPRRHDHEP